MWAHLTRVKNSCEPVAVLWPERSSGQLCSGLGGAVAPHRPRPGQHTLCPHLRQTWSRRHWRTHPDQGPAPRSVWNGHSLQEDSAHPGGTWGCCPGPPPRHHGQATPLLRECHPKPSLSVLLKVTASERPVKPGTQHPGPPANEPGMSSSNFPAGTRVVSLPMAVGRGSWPPQGREEQGLSSLFKDWEWTGAGR